MAWLGAAAREGAALARVGTARWQPRVAAATRWAFSEHRLCFMERRHLQLESVSLWQLFASFMLQQATGVRAG